ncbi:MAG TPA: hypothetical protein PK771_00775 [Spirochaetota bacterium]|nr:hypothetical protein [Spirochaetota bacterium]
MYVGGIFTAIGGQSRSNIAAIDITTGLATSWDPNLDNCVYSLIVSGSTIYAGGSFNTYGADNKPLLNIGAFDTATGLPRQ